MFGFAPGVRFSSLSSSCSWAVNRMLPGPRAGSVRPSWRPTQRKLHAARQELLPGFGGPPSDCT